MRRLSLALALAACSSQTTPCEQATEHVRSCLADHCAGAPEASICVALAAGTIAAAESCDGDRLVQAQAAAGASCSEIVASAALSLGKTDAPCPYYFPWCGEIAPEGAGYSLHVLAAGPEYVTLQLDLDDLGRRPLDIDGAPYESFTLDGAGTLDDIGAPDLPAVGVLVGVPWGASDVRVAETVAVVEESLFGVRPTPLRAADRDDLAPEPYVVDPVAYGSYDLYPAASAAIEAPVAWRDYRVARLELHPLRAVPALGEVVVARSLQVTVRWSGGQDGPVGGTGAAMDPIYAGSIVNYDSTPARAGTDSTLDYLVVVDDALEAALSPWLEAKTAAGLGVQVVRASEISPMSPEALRARVLEVYQASHPSYLLLVGAPDKLPLYHYGSSWEPVPSDAYYGFLEGDDYLAELAVGRFLARTPEELGLVVAKTLAYAAGDPLAAWRRRLLVVAHEQMYPQKYTACVKDIVAADRGRPVEWVALYGGEGAGNAQLTQAINDGVGVVSYRGHGEETQWSEWGEGGPYAAKDQPIANGEKTPVVLSIACLTAQIEQPGSLAEQFTVRADGAVAFLGATQPSWTVQNHDFNRYLFTHLLERNVHAIGLLNNQASASLIRQYGVDQAAGENVRMYLWLGDPGLEIGRGYHCEPLAAADAGPDVTLPAGGAVQASLGAPAVEGTSYAWESLDGKPVALSCTDCAQPVATPAVTTTYRLRVRNGCGSAEDTVTVTVEAPVYSHTVVLDGADDFTAGEELATTSAGYTAHVAWDADALTIGYQGPDVAAGAESRWLLLFLDVDPGTGTGAAQGEVYNTQRVGLPAGFGAEHVVRWRTSGYVPELQTYSDGAFTSEAADIAIAKGGDLVEIRIPRSVLGASVVGITTLMINEQPGAEWAYAGLYPSSFTDGYYPTIPVQGYLLADFAGKTQPNDPANHRP